MGWLVIYPTGRAVGLSRIRVGLGVMVGCISWQVEGVDSGVMYHSYATFCEPGKVWVQS